MDRTILPEIPAGEDEGAVVGVVGPDNMGRNSTMVKGRVIRARLTVATTVKAALVDRIAALAEDQADVREVRTGRSSAGLVP